MSEEEYIADLRMSEEDRIADLHRSKNNVSRICPLSPLCGLRKNEEPDP